MSRVKSDLSCRVYLTHTGIHPQTKGTGIAHFILTTTARRKRGGRGPNGMWDILVAIEIEYEMGTTQHTPHVLVPHSQMDVI